MKIYIDESGLFSQHKDSNTADKAWCAVGALTVPHRKEKEVRHALLDLKKELGVKEHEEIKSNRPDPGSLSFVSFIEKIKSANCTFHAMTINRFHLNDDSTKTHRESQISARNKYIDDTRNERGEEETILLEKEVLKLKKSIESLSNQEYIQIVAQSLLVSHMLDKVMTYYASTAPRELSRFSWVIDKKNETIRTYEDLYLKLMPEFVRVGYIKELRGLNLTVANSSYLWRNYGHSRVGMEQKEIERRKRLYDVDYSKISDSMIAFNFDKLLNQDVTFSDSKKTDGLQVADLVISSINRLLKGNVDNVKKSSKLLGPLFLNSPRLDFPSVPQLYFHNSKLDKPEAYNTNLELLNVESKELYNKQFRAGFTKNFNEFKQSKGQ